MRKFLLLSGLVCLSAACAPAPTISASPSPASPAASGTPVATASTAPTPTPSPLASTAAATPTPVHSPTAPAFAWKDGKQLKAYDFKGVGGIFYETSETALYVVDAVDDNQTPRRYLVRKFNADGSFQASFKLAPSGSKDPDAVDGIAFDRRGIPFFTYHDYDKDVYSKDRDDRTWRVLKLITAAVVPATKLPSNSLPRASVSAIASDGDVFTIGALRLDPDKNVSDNRQIYYVRAEEDQQPQAIFAVPDPFAATTLMAMAPAGTLYACGPLQGGGFAIKTVTQDQQVKSFATLSGLPSAMWAGPKGAVYTATNSTSGAATIRKYGADGAEIGSTPAKLADGSDLLRVAGMTVDGTGRIYVTATGLDSAKQPISGIYTFAE